jgi:hypothetical protein
MRIVLRQTNSGDAMQIVTMQHIHLASAYLCPDCNCVGNSSQQCPACACEVLMGLASVLNREEEVAQPVAFANFKRPSAVPAWAA